MLNTGVQKLACFRKTDTAAAALKELYPERRLQSFHLTGKRRLRNIQPQSRMAYVSFLNDSIKCLHIFDFHNILLAHI